MVRFILASESPRRSELLRQIGLAFDIVPSNVDEQKVPLSNPRSYVKRLAELKAKTVAKLFDEGIIIGADTVVCIGGKIIGKPKDKDDAIKTLRKLSGKVHRVVSGLCVVDKYSGMTITRVVVTLVKFRKLDDGLIARYVETGDPVGKAGSYGIQNRGAVLVEWVKGDYFNVVGLPLATLAEILDEMGYSGCFFSKGP